MPSGVKPGFLETVTNQEQKNIQRYSLKETPKPEGRHYLYSAVNAYISSLVKVMAHDMQGSRQDPGAIRVTGF